MSRRLLAALMATLAIVCPPSFAGPGEVQVFGALALKSFITDIAPGFERETGYKLSVQYGPAGAIRKRIESNEAWDVAVLPSETMAALAKDGRFAGSATPVARAGLGLIVRAGAARPDIRSPDGVRHALLQARAFSFSKEGITADQAPRLVETLGIAGEMKGKLMPVALAADSVAAGESDLGLVVVSALAPSPSIELAGPLPPQLQKYIDYAAAPASSADAKAAQAFIAYLRSPAAAAALARQRGLEAP